MSIISKMRRQDAVYWPPATEDDYGGKAYGTLVELVLGDSGNFRVRWEDKNEEFLDGNGTTRRSMALVYVPRLPDASEVAVGGFLWLGARADLTDESDPTLNDGAWEVRRVDHLPTLKATETLRTAYL